MTVFIDLPGMHLVIWKGDSTEKVSLLQTRFSEERHTCPIAGRVSFSLFSWTGSNGSALGFGGIDSRIGHLQVDTSSSSIQPECMPLIMCLLGAIVSSRLDPLVLPQ